MLPLAAGVLRCRSSPPAAALSWLGRQGTRAVAASLFIGVMLPPLAALLKPIFAYALFAAAASPSCASTRSRCAGISRARAGRRRRAWMMLAHAAADRAVAGRARDGGPPARPLHRDDPAGRRPPVISAPTLAALMGLDAALSLATLVVCTAVTPLTAPVFAALFVGEGMTLSPIVLGSKLFADAGRGLPSCAWLVRRIAGQPWIDRQMERIDGLSVIALFFFAVALMDGVLYSILNEPLKVLGLTLLSFGLSFGLPD
jgi:BASS family bile acid:Na+ symporter